MKVGSTFTGVGGLDLGFEQAGMEIEWQCEQDEKCRRILKRHWPNTPCFTDVRNVGKRERPSDYKERDTAAESERVDRSADPVHPEPTRRSAGARSSGGAGGGTRDEAADLSVDVLTGGFPCQDLSVAGKRAGLAGDRSGLFFEFARIANDLVRPGGWIVIENVPGLLSSNGGRDFAVVLASLAEIGFHDLAWRVLDSRYFGVPQRRRRIFIVARRTRGSSAKSVLLEPESGGGNPAKGGKAGARVAETLTRGSHSPGKSAPGRRQEDDVNLVVGALTRRPHGTDENEILAGHTFIDDRQVTASALKGSPGRGYRVDAEGAAGNHIITTAQDQDMARCVTTGQRYDLDTETFVAHTLTSRGYDASEDGTERGSPQGRELAEQLARELGTPLPELPQQGARRGQPAPTRSSVRRLTPTETERLQGFPDGWTQLPEQIDGTANPKPDSHRYAQMGNAVTVPVARWIGERIMGEVGE